MINERGPILHELKIWPKYFTDVKNGRKPFELRKYDRDFQEGDTLLLREYNPGSGQYTGQETTKKVTYVLVLSDFFRGCEPSGYVILGLAAETPPNLRLTQKQLNALTIDDGVVWAVPPLADFRIYMTVGDAQWGVEHDAKLSYMAENIGLIVATGKDMIWFKNRPTDSDIEKARYYSDC